MPRAKAKTATQTTSKSRKPAKKVVEEETLLQAEETAEPENLDIGPVAEKNQHTSKSVVNKIKKSKRIMVFILILIVLASLVYYKKQWFIAATVDGKPITNFELLYRMNKQYRAQTLNQMINERIVLDEASKKGIIITNADIDNKIADIEKNVGGPQALASLLAQQNMTQDSLRDQVKIQLAIEKMYGSEASVSAKEVQDYIDQNKDQLTSTDSAEQVKEATQALTQQKISQIFDAQFSTLKQDADVKIY